MLMVDTLNRRVMIIVVDGASAGQNHSGVRHADHAGRCRSAAEDMDLDILSRQFSV
jgi:hypothetical protein